MNLNTRISRLEKITKQAEKPAIPDLFERIKAQMAFDAGLGPEPPPVPCPPWLDPAEWERGERICKALRCQSRGEPLPELTPEEADYVKSLEKVFDRHLDQEEIEVLTQMGLLPG